ncbi:MAG: dTMP kinase [Dehalococcoidia bacterium]
MRTRGRFVTLEGGEGAGKSTQIEALAALARDAGIEVVTCREPGGTVLGERLRAALFDLDRAPEPLAELLVFNAARAQLVAEVIRPALEAGALVLCDRFTDSTVAYQHYGRGLPLETVEAVNRAATGGLTPDLTLLFDLPPEVGRARGQHGGSDYLEREALAFHERVRAGYLALAGAVPERWLVLDATLPPEELTRLAWERLANSIGIASTTS